MFVGHIGVALAAKGIAPKTSLPVLILAAVFLDVLWPIFLVAGLEHARIEPGFTAVSPLVFYDFPYSHSLLAAMAWAGAFGAAYFFFRGDSWGGKVLAALVLSHWPLDLVVHRPDLLLYPGGGERYGYALWDSVGHTLLLEGTIFLVGILLYLGATRATDDTGHYSFWSLMLLLGLGWLGSIYGPAPPTLTAVVVAGLAGMLVILAWAGWIERHRVAARS
jgi:hypothetical protein